LLWLVGLPFLIFLTPLPEARRGQETAVLLQPNIPETEQFTQESLDRTVRSLVGLTLKTALTGGAQQPSLLVWPEVPAPFYYYEDGRFRQAINDLARAAKADVLLGVVGHTPQGAPLNSAVLVSPAGELVSRYDKIKLVPFGEYVPWPFGFARHISSEISDFVPGTQIVVSPVGGSHKLGAFICYESVFPNLVRQFAANGAEALLNLSNDGYFGRFAARAQHLKLVRMRAVENQRWILRATNDGFSAVIDPAGRVRGSLPPYVQGASRVGFTYIASQTLYTRWGDWFAILSALIAAGTVAYVIRAGLPAHPRP
jgi:apolipoprotein N-acyltransferase